MAMDVIIPYVIWITLLAWLMDLALRQLHKTCFRGRKEAGDEFYRHQNIWQEYGDHVVLERINLQVKRASFAQWLARPAVVNRPFASAARSGATDPRRHPARQPSRWRQSRTTVAAWFQRYSVFPASQRAG